ncbi:MAG: helix-turn-helix domain-containing protein [Myxococcota bacterium]
MIEPARVLNGTAPPADWERAARQLLRALRGQRSQVAFSRRLGYRSNPIADWEAGRRFPTAAEMLRAAARAGVDVPSAFAGFDASTAAHVGDADDQGVADWMSTWRGGATLQEVAERCDCSRYAVGRWLSGKTRPRVPDFLRLVEALTGRAADLVAELVDISQVPSLAPLRERNQALRTLEEEVPWASAVLLLLRSDTYLDLPAHRPGWLGNRLGLTAEQEAQSLDLLEAVGGIAWDGTRYRPLQPGLVHPSTATEGMAHWTQMAEKRLQTPTDRDRFSGVVFLTDDAGFEQVREAVRQTMQRLGAHNSENASRVGVVQVAVMDLSAAQPSNTL